MGVGSGEGMRPSPTLAFPSAFAGSLLHVPVPVLRCVQLSYRLPPGFTSQPWCGDAHWFFLQFAKILRVGCPDTAFPFST